MSVQILNRPGCYTTVKRARKYVNAGRAEWVGDRAIRFRSPAELQALRLSIEAQALRARAANAQYEADREIHKSLATPRQMRGVPINNHRDLVAPRGRSKVASVFTNKPGRTAGEREFLEAQRRALRVLPRA